MLAVSTGAIVGIVIVVVILVILFVMVLNRARRG
jgi:hypothetical protein